MADDNKALAVPKSKAWWDMAKRVLTITNPLLGGVILLSERSIDEAEAARGSDLEALRLEAARLELHARIAADQAKVAQEVSIARRIERSAEVEIEEYYDTSGDGAAGVTNDEKGLFVGARGAGRRVTRRIYRFKGTTDIIHDADPEDIK